MQEKLENKIYRLIWLEVTCRTLKIKNRKFIGTPRGEKLNCAFTKVLTIVCHIVALLHTYALFV